MSICWQTRNTLLLQYLTRKLKQL